MMRKAYRVGERVHSTARLDLAPAGTVINEHNMGEAGSHWVRDDDGRWSCENRSRGINTDGFGDQGQYKILSYPAGFEAPTSAWVETVHQFKWRFRDVSLMNARRSGIEFDPVVRGLSRLGLDREQFPLGPGVLLCNRDDLNTLPTGSLIQHGNPEFPRTFAVYRKSGGWDRVLGNAQLNDYDMVEVLTMPGVDEPPEWVTETASGAEGEQALAQFKALAWKVGFALKQRHSWCSTFENTMTTLGVDERCLSALVQGEFTVGSMVDQEQAARLPEGTVLRHQREGLDVFYFRTDESTNSSRTRRLFGYREDGTMGHTAAIMTVVAHPVTGPLFISVPERVLDSCPVGTLLATNPHGGDRYIKCPDGAWTSWRGGDIPANGRHNSSAFSGYRVVEVPGLTFPYTNEEI